MGCFLLDLHAGCQKPGFLPKYLIQTLNLGKNPVSLVPVRSSGNGAGVSSNRGFRGCTGGRGRLVFVGSDRALSGARRSRNLPNIAILPESAKKD